MSDMSNEQTKSKGLIALQEYNDKVKSGEIERTAPKTPLQKWEEDKTSLRKSCNAMCYACMGGDMGDNVKKEIKECSSKDCALWLVRPYK